MPFPHKFITLTPEEAKKIEKELLRLALARKWRKRDPLQALYLSGWGVGVRGGRGARRITFQGIAKYLDVDYSTVKRWVALYDKIGIDAFIKWINRPGFGKGRRV
ncbi:MAG: helix-turn-helix domain-containing protein [Planctomycetota bacterium]|nr:helix-turn-helix domain-containing protein [Planctomycetota bacterium]